MRERNSSRSLLTDARVRYDARTSVLRSRASAALLRGFGGGTEWFALALAETRGQDSIAMRERAQAIGHAFGAAKYALSLFAAVLVVAAGRTVGAPWFVVAALATLAFYAIEAQMVFLLVLVADDCPAPWRASRELTRRAGGTLSVMGIVLPIAATMLFGGFTGRGFIRSWCIGCMAIVLWYESLRRDDSQPVRPSLQRA
jgi:hypothetical protein